MGKLFTLTDDIKDTIRGAVDDLIDQLGKKCRLVYPPKFTACSNCVADAIGKKPGSRWRHGGPVPFPNGSVCPLCQGAGGHHAEEKTEEITLLCQWAPSEWLLGRGGVNVRIPTGTVRTKGYRKDLEKILMAQKIVLQTAMEPYVRYYYVLDGEPVDESNIVQGRYVVCNWRRE